MRRWRGWESAEQVVVGMAAQERILDCLRLAVRSVEARRWQGVRRGRGGCEVRCRRIAAERATEGVDDLRCTCTCLAAGQFWKLSDMPYLKISRS